MVEINMSGRGGPQRPTYQGAYQGNVQDPGVAARQQAFEQAQRQQAATQARMGSQWDKATAQQAKQRSQETQQASVRMRRDEANQRRMDQLLEREIRQREAMLRANEREMRMQQIQEASLRRTHGNLAHRAAWNLPPGGFRSVARGAQVYNERIQAFQSRWGRAPATPGGATITDTLGDMRGAYGVQNIGRLGSMGQRAADTRSWVGLAKVEHDLNRIDKSVSDQLKFWRSPAQRATVQRQENQLLLASLVRQQVAVGRARDQIAAGTATLPPMLRQFAAGLGGRGGGGGGGGGGIGIGGSGGPMGRVARGAGRAFGLGALAATNPIVGMAIAAAETVAFAPYVANQAYAGIIDKQRPYMNYRLGIMAAARGGVSGGMTAGEIEGNMLPLAGLIPGNARSSRQRLFGLGALDYQNAWQGAGMNSRTFGQYQGEAESIRMAYATPGNVLGEETFGKLLGQGKTLGAVTPGAGTRDAYFRKLQEVMTIATAKGVDATQLASSWSNLMQLSTRGVSTNVGGMADFMTKMVGSGSPGMRSGEGVVSLASDIQQSALSLGAGGNVAGNVVLSRAFQKAGGAPRSAEGLRAFLGISPENWKAKLANNPTAQQALTNYLDAASRGDAPSTARWAGVLMADEPGAFMSVLDKSGLGAGGPSVRGQIMTNYAGTNLPAGLAMEAAPNAAASLGGAAPSVSPGIFAAAQAASEKTGLPVSTILAIGAAESRLDPNAVSPTGVRGFMQVTQQTGKDLGFSSGELATLPGQATAGAMRFKQMLQLTDGDPAKAMELYNMGPAALRAVMSGKGVTDAAQSDAARFSNYQTQYSSMSDTFATLSRGAEGDTARLEGAKSIYEEHTIVTGAFDNIAAAADRLIRSFTRLGSKIDKNMGPDAAYPTWDGMPLSYSPSYTQPVK